LVFLFMAATVVSIVIFLCGVLVGRGVRAERGGPSDAATTDSSPSELTAAQPTSPATTPSGADPTKAAPPPQVDDLTYFRRLEQKTDSAETLSGSARHISSSDARGPGQESSKPAPARSASSSPSSKAAPGGTSSTPVASASSGPATQAPLQAPGPGFAVQV